MADHHGTSNELASTDEALAGIGRLGISVVGKNLYLAASYM